jgi:hypothetical protein
MIKKYNDLIILAIIWIVSIYSVISVIVYSYEIGIQNYIGYGLLIGISILRFIKIKKIKTILGVFLIVGSINVIQFTYSAMIVFFSLSWPAYGDRTVSFGIQPLSTILLIFLIVVNRSDFIGLIANIFFEDPQIAIERRKRTAAKHYNELKSENDSKLQEIIDNKNMYQLEYVKAAQKLIEERKEK